MNSFVGLLHLLKLFQYVKQVHLPYSSSNFIQVFIDKVDYASGQLKCISFVWACLCVGWIIVCSISDFIFRQFKLWRLMLLFMAKDWIILLGLLFFHPQSYIVCDMHQKISLLWSFLKNHPRCKILVFLTCCKQVWWNILLLAILKDWLWGFF